MSDKFCINCKHYRTRKGLFGILPNLSWCDSPNNIKIIYSLDDMRVWNDNVGCGKDGIWFESK
jgi:hypothetical protein